MNLLKQIQDRVDNILDYFGHYFFYLILLLHVVYIFIFIGISAFNSIYLNMLDIFIQSFVCLFLLFRFHPFRKHKLREYDADIIFSSALFLLFNMILVELFKMYKYEKTQQVQTDTTIGQSPYKLVNPVVKKLMPLQSQ
jgi:hypothetical protein